MRPANSVSFVILGALALAACQGPVDGPAALVCPNGELLDGEACVPAACGIGRWGDLPVDGNTVYVDVAAASGGDGSEGAALDSLQAGVDLAVERDGALVAVASGVYTENVEMGDGYKDIAVAGRCRERVTIDGSAGDGGDESPTISIVGLNKRPDVTLEGVTVSGGTYAGLYVGQATVAVRSSDFRGNVVAGVLALAGGTVTLDDVGVYDSIPNARGAYGRGINVEDGGSLTATACTVEGNTDVGVFASATGTTVALVDTRVAGTLAGNSDESGRGVSVQYGATLTASGCTVEGNRAAAMHALGAGTVLDVEDTVLAGTLSGTGGTGGWGVGLAEGAAFSATGLTIEGNVESGVFGSGAGTTIDLTDTEVLNTVASPAGGSGRGISVVDGAVLTAVSCVVQGNTEAGLHVAGAGSAASLTDTWILDTSPDQYGALGDGISAVEGASLHASGCTIQRSTEVGIHVDGAGSTAELEDTEVLDTSPTPDGAKGRGINVEGGATLTATQCTVERNTEVGVYGADSGTTITLIDTRIADTWPSPAGQYGRGISVADGTRISADGCVIEGNSEVGVYASDTGTTVVLVDVDVLDTHSLPDGAAGRGINVQYGATLAASGCSIQRATDIGVFAGGAGTVVDLVSTTVLDTSPRPDGATGRGLGVEDGAWLTATDCTVEGNADVGVFATGPGADVALVRTDVVTTKKNRTTGFAVGLLAQLGAVVHASDLVVSGTEGPGVYVVYEGIAELERVQLAESLFAGALAMWGTLEMDACAITDTRPDGEWGGGFGVYVGGTLGPSVVTLSHSSIGQHPYAAVWLDGEGAYDIVGNTLAGSSGVEAGSALLHGNAIFAENGVTAWDGSDGLRISGNTLAGTARAAVLLDASSAALDANTWSGEGTDVVQQRCDGIVALTDDDLAGVPDPEICPAGNMLTAYDLSFTSLYLPTAEPVE